MSVTPVSPTTNRRSGMPDSSDERPVERRRDRTVRKLRDPRPEVMDELVVGGAGDCTLVEALESHRRAPEGEDDVPPKRVKGAPGHLGIARRDVVAVGETALSQDISKQQQRAVRVTGLGERRQQVTDVDQGVSDA